MKTLDQRTELLDAAGLLRGADACVTQRKNAGEHSLFLTPGIPLHMHRAARTLRCWWKAAHPCAPEV